MPAETSDTARLRLVSNQPVVSGDHRREEGAGRKPDEHAIGELEAMQRVGAARQHQRQAEQHRADQHDDAGAEAVADARPSRSRRRP